MLADCISTRGNIETNGDFPKAVLAGDQDLANCNVDKRALRAFYDGVNKALTK